MSDNSLSKEMHKKIAVDTFNEIWPLLEKKNPDEKDKELLIDMGHTSLYHWRCCGKDINLQRGQWMVSHIYSVLDMGESALYHAQKCFELTEKNNFLDFDMAYAYEAMARAAACSGKKIVYEKYIAASHDAALKIKKTEDKELFLSDLEAGPWYDERMK